MHNYRISVEEEGRETLVFHLESHDDLQKIIGRIEEKYNLSPDLAAAFATGLKLFAQCARDNQEKPPFREIMPILNDIMKIVKKKE